MINQKEALIARGLALVAQQSQQADLHSTSITALLEEIQLRLRAPQVNNFLLSLSPYPDFLQQLWAHFGPAIGKNSFEQEADNIREKALLETVPEIPEVSWDVATEKARLRAHLDTHFYLLPKLLLMATLFDEASFRGIAAPRGRQQTAETTDAELPQGYAAGTIKVALVNPQTAPEQIQQLFESVRQQHQLPLMPLFYSGLGNWPNFMHEAWQQIMPLVGSSDYKNLKDFLSYQAQIGLRKLPLTQPDLTTLAAEDKDAVQAILAAYRYKLLPEMLIDTAMMKAMLDGAENAFTSPFSLTAVEEEEEEESPEGPENGS